VNIGEYISSGIVESYVLGLADETERKEFEEMCAAHPKVRAARDSFEISLEENAKFGQLQPRANVKSKIFSAIEMDLSTVQSQLSSGNNGGIPPVIRNESGSSSGGANERSSAAVVRMKTYKWQSLIAAAAVVLLVLSTALNFYFFNQYKRYYSEYQSLVTAQTELAAHNQVMETRLLEYEKAVDMMKDPGMAMVKMSATSNNPDPTSATMVFWDTASKDVYLAVSKLPKPATGEQYQLWALVDGKPVDAGVFDMKDGPGMMKMKNIPKAQAFAITLEKRGGSPTPTMEKLYVMGKV
jgi:anti-sigma-K factor RskA